MKPQFYTIIALSVGLAVAPAAEIVVTTDPGGPLEVGEEVTVQLSVEGWDANDPEVDAVAFNIDFDPTYLVFVPGTGETLEDGTEFLALPNQGAGYNPEDDSSDALVDYGRYIFGATDVGDATAGSVGPVGPLGSFRLRAVAPGSTTIEASSNNPKSVFSDTELYGIAPSGGVVLGAATVVVKPPPLTYARWASTIPFASEADALPGADPDADGRENSLEYFLDANPLRIDRDRDPAAGTVDIGGRQFATLSYERPAGIIARSDVKDVGERSIDLENWSRDEVIVESVSAIDPTTGRETVVLRTTTPIGALEREFLRLNVTLN